LKSAIPVAQKGCDETSTQQLPPGLLRASAQKAMPVFDFCARMEFMVGTGGADPRNLTKVER
jgi:hypothetical protein